MVARLAFSLAVQNVLATEARNSGFAVTAGASAFEIDSIQESWGNIGLVGKFAHQSRI
jgi:hypothetical protein